MSPSMRSRALAGLVSSAAIVACAATEPSTPPCASCQGGGAEGGGAAAPDGAPGPETAPPGTPDAGPSPTKPLKVLFVGNSYTFYNDLPAVVRALGAATPGAAVEVESIAQGGATLRDHWTSTGARARIEAGGLDAVVLQAQSLEPVFSPESFHYYGDLLGAAVRATPARAVWFATWARRAGDPIYGAAMTPASLTASLEYRYKIVASTNAPVDPDTLARVGAAWQIALAELPGVTLHDPDGSHPSPAGTLLSGCVILQAITGRAPRVPEPPPLGLSAATAHALCAIAPRVLCLEGRDYCDGRCVDTARDVRHCGACGEACAAGDPCREGRCGCDAGLLGCDRVCVDPRTDAYHCGACRKRCDPGKACQGGACACTRATATRVTQAQLTALRPGCASTSDRGSLACAEAAHALCAPTECFDSGFGPLGGHAPVVDDVLCVKGDVQKTTYAALATQVPGCDGSTERNGSRCVTAIHRYCAASGAVTGFGPVGTAADEVTVTCLPSASVLSTTLPALSAFASRCTPDSITCPVAAWSFCVSLGFAGGFGPVEVAGDDVRVACVPR